MIFLKFITHLFLELPDFDFPVFVAMLFMETEDYHYPLINCLSTLPPLVAMPLTLLSFDTFPNWRFMLSSSCEEIEACNWFSIVNQNSWEPVKVPEKCSAEGDIHGPET